jgi:hypothetical protein
MKKASYLHYHITTFTPATKKTVVSDGLYAKIETNKGDIILALIKKAP